MNIYSTSQFIEKSNVIHNNCYQYYLTDYRGIFQKIIITCKIHGNFKQTPNDHLDGNGCPKCGVLMGAKKRTKTTEWFVNSAKLIHKSKYIYTDAIYIGWNKKIKIICPTHGQFQIRPNNHLNGQGCPTCGIESAKQIQTKSLNTFILEANKIHHNKYLYSNSIYLGDNIKLLITCLKHGNFLQTPGSHLYGSGCPKCKLSSGELSIEQFLKENLMEYKSQIKFDDCKNIKKFAFDFGVYNKNKLIGLIEFQGKQHYSIIPTWGGKKALDKVIFRDQIKEEYCLRHDIPLLKIPYWEQSNIDSILKTYIKKHLTN
jgi:hypothetical protein